MTYFSPDILAFFSELRENNTREWFKEHKKRYEKNVKAPFKNFTEALIEQTQIADPSIILTAKDAIFRIHRDIRFSKDKTPYQNHVSAAIGRGGKKHLGHKPGIYIELSDKAFSIYSGVYQTDTKRLQSIREAIASQPAEFARLLEAPAFVEKFGGTIHGDKNKRIPKEFKEAAEQQPLIYNKSFYYFHKFEPNIILEPHLLDQVMAYFYASRPFADFFGAALEEAV